MNVISKFTLQLSDILLRVAPGSITDRFLVNIAIVKFLMQSGGIKNSKAKLRALGFQGKWTDSVEVSPAGESRLVTLLMQALNIMKVQQDALPPAYLPSHEWRRLLEDQWSCPLSFARDGDVVGMSAFLRNFFRNEGLSGFWGQRNMFQIFKSADAVREHIGECLMHLDMEVLNEYLDDWTVDDLDAPRVGNPWGYKVKNKLIYEPAFSYFSQAEFVDRLIGGGTGSPVVLEIGGGFGGLASHLIKRNKKIKYIGLDLPENVIIQTYYLSCVFPELNVYCYNEEFKKLDQCMLDNFDIIILPNYRLAQIDEGLIDMLVNIRSLSEMSMETISEYYSQIERVKPKYYFHENIYKDRGDGLHGIPSNRFPVLKNYRLIYSSPSRWPKYGADSIYPCHENLYQCLA